MKKLLFLIALIIMPIVIANSDSMTLLAVSELSNGSYKGNIAKLNLEIKPGTGQIFIDTYPFSKVDTQISTRFAKQIACDFADIDCSNIDFFYTIKANSYIIGGPSGSASITALTAMMLLDIKFNHSIALSGTINSGGFIGPVSGLKEKISAAQKNNISKILIPKGTRIKKSSYLNKSNETINETTDLVLFGEKIGIIVQEVSSIEEVITELSGINFITEDNIQIEVDYKKTMKKLATKLCLRSQELRDSIQEYDNIKTIDENLTRYKESINLTKKAFNAIDKDMFYSGASLCFGANIRLRELLVDLQNNTDEKLLQNQINVFDKLIEQNKYQTITDLQAYMVVKERILEANESLNKFHETNNTKQYAYAIERFYSAKSWSEFLTNTGKKFEFNDDTLMQSCIDKISEADERIQYLNLIINSNEANNELKKSKEDRNNNHYELCLFHASKAKALANSILHSIGTSDAIDFINNKLNVTEKVIAKKISKGVFPIVGYSYYEYARNLAETDPYSSILYGEYALELSDMQIYFKDKTAKKHKEINLNFVSPENITYFLVGLIAGILIMYKKR